MSHDIYAIKQVGDQTEQVAYLSIGAGNTVLQTLLYESLDAQAYNNLTSGCGDEVIYSRQAIATAKTKLHYLNTENVLQWAKAGRNPFYDLLSALSGADVLDDGTMLNKPDNLIILGKRDESQEGYFQRVQAFYDQILRDGVGAITIQFH